MQFKHTDSKYAKNATQLSDSKSADAVLRSGGDHYLSNPPIFLSGHKIINS